MKNKIKNSTKKVVKRKQTEIITTDEQHLERTLSLTTIKKINKLIHESKTGIVIEGRNCCIYLLVDHHKYLNPYTEAKRKLIVKDENIFKQYIYLTHPI